MRDQTVRLTTGQALVRWLQAQWSERDGVRRRAVPAMFGIFGHGQVLGLGQALVQEGAELPFHQPKNEQAMVHTAMGFAKAAGGCRRWPAPPRSARARRTCSPAPRRRP